MSVSFTLITIWIREQSKWRGLPLHEALLECVRSRRIAGRAAAFKATSGCFEDGSLASQHVVDLAHNLPVVVEVVVPAAEAPSLLEEFEEMVTQGIVLTQELNLHSYRTPRRLLPPGLRVRDAMTPSPTAVRPETPLLEAVDILLSSPFNGLPVEMEGKVVGIITQTDLIERGRMPIRLGLLSYIDQGTREGSLTEMSGRTAAEVMTRDPVTVSSDAFLIDAVDLMLKRELKRLPVLDENGILEGVLSRVDIFRTVMSEARDRQTWEAQHVELDEQALVADATIHDVPVVRPATPLENIIGLVDATETQRVVVLDDEEKPVGVISDRDLLAAFRTPSSDIGESLGRLLGLGHLDAEEKARAATPSDVAGRTARDVMQPSPITVPETASLETAVDLFTQHHLKRLPVVGEDGRYKGMLSRDALLRADIRRAR